MQGRGFTDGRGDPRREPVKTTEIGLKKVGRGWGGFLGGKELNLIMCFSAGLENPRSKQAADKLGIERKA